MAKLFPCDDQPNGIGGFVMEFPSGTRKQAAWQSKERLPSLDTAKQCAANMIDTLQKEGRIDDLERTNWASVVAAVQRIVDDWNGRNHAPTLQ